MAISPGKGLLAALRNYSPLPGGVRRYGFHPVPVVPFIRLHEPDYLFLISKEGSGLRALVPDLEALREMARLAWGRLAATALPRTSQLYLVVLSPLASPTAATAHLRNSFLIATGILNTEMINLTRKLKTNGNELLNKIGEGSNTTPLGSVQEKWKVMKEKLPEWQKKIAGKMHDLQEMINKRIS